MSPITILIEQSEIDEELLSEIDSIVGDTATVIDFRENVNTVKTDEDACKLLEIWMSIPTSEIHLFGTPPVILRHALFYSSSEFSCETHQETTVFVYELFYEKGQRIWAITGTYNIPVNNSVGCKDAKADYKQA